MLNPVPFDVVRDMGADRVIAVHTMHDLSGALETEPPSYGLGAEAFVRLLLYRSRWTPLMRVTERSLCIMLHKLVEHRLQECPPDVMIEVPLRSVGLFDLDQVDVCVSAGEGAARQRLTELIELRDAALPGRWARWWRSAVQKLTGRGPH